MSDQGSFVCTECIEDLGIRGFIESRNTKGDCSFCSSRGTPVALLDDVAGHMKICLYVEYDDANDWLISDEGDYNILWWDTCDLLTDVIMLELPNDLDNKLLQEIVDLLPGHSWCMADPYDVPGHEKVRYDWAWFSEVVMHHRRFFFENYGRETHDDNLSPGEFLERVFSYSENYDLFQPLPKGTRLFRARFKESGAKLTSAQQLGPPPKDRATQANRMSPTGIPMFYGCDESETALRESAKGCGQFAIGCFRTRRNSIILDLTKIPGTSGIFHVFPGTMKFRPREILGFLNHVAEEVSRPSRRGERAQMDYVPTQVVTEFVRNKLTRGGIPIDGIKYRSAVHNGRACYVFFADQGNLSPAPEGSWVSDTDRWLELAQVCEREVTEEDIERWKKEMPERYRRDYHRLLYGNDSTE